MTDGSFIRCVLMAFAIFAVLQNILIAGQTSPDVCRNELFSCIARALQPYTGLNSEQTLAKARTTPFAIHCTDWSVAMECDRRQLRSEVCQNVTNLSSGKLVKFIKTIDLAVNYTCKENFLRINRIYRCVLDQDVLNNITGCFGSVAFNVTNICEKIPDFVECAANGLTSRCGSDAGNVAREFGPQFLEAFIEAELHPIKC